MDFTATTSPAIIQILPAGKNYLWAPKDDITTSELARAMPILLGAASGRADAALLVEKLPPEVRRHFEEQGR